jgi:uncharacterized protein (UPF0261 family)
MPVILVGTLDTKGVEIAFVRDLLSSAGVATVVVDAGVREPAGIIPDIPRDRVYSAAGVTLDAIQQANDRGQAIAAAAAGVAHLVLHHGGQLTDVQGILALGGSAGTTIGTAAMRALPFGIPKVMVSTLASGQVKPYVGVRDICMMNSVVDISGLNRISRMVLANAAAAMIGMVRANSLVRPIDPLEGAKPLVTATMFGVTTPCVEAARQILERLDYEVLVFHATGTGGQTMESFITDGLIKGVLDITTTELADELVGGVLSAGPERLTAAARRGVPQVISLGALDMVNFGPRPTVPERFGDRLFYQHNPNVTLMRTTPRENDLLGKEIAQKASAARGPTAVLMPLRGLSAIDCEGKPFWWPQANQALFQSLRSGLGPHVRLIELDMHINDTPFAEAAVRTLFELMGNGR